MKFDGGNFLIGFSFRDLMALSLDDKILGEKTHYYCDSSDDEGERRSDGESDNGSNGNAEVKQSEVGPSIHRPDVLSYDGHCTRTGPKGVIEDHRIYERLKEQQRIEADRAFREECRRKAIVCRTAAEDQREENMEKQLEQELEREMDELEREFLAEYRQRRLLEMKMAIRAGSKFGHLIELKSADEFRKAIDGEDSQTLVFIHLYKRSLPACEAMNGCLHCLAKEYPQAKFCRILAEVLSTTSRFQSKGLPALLAYKNRELVGNFVRISDDLGTDFFAGDLERFLAENGVLPEPLVGEFGRLRFDNSQPDIQAKGGDNGAGVDDDDNDDEDFDID